MKINQLPAPVLTYGLVPLAHRLILLHTFMIRTEVVDEEVITSRLDRGEKGIVAIWHQRMYGVIGYAKAASRYRPSAIISRSGDGDLISELVRRLHFRPIRGSSSRGGKEALAAIVEDLKENLLAIHAVDGPRGPGGTVKAGLIRMAELSGAKIFPVYVSFSRAWPLRSWDRFLIPKPFSRVRIRWDQPISVPANMKEQEFESIRRSLEIHMRQNQITDDRSFGQESLLLEP
ncbi:MAG: lysophospholipid acyltransferase family protein [Smithellaceae bacterium]|jgi:hypothetical protein|nr:lysophospholipid acyltransferase family protein [Smithellaceae bacterium]MDD3260243.1 lysophospholipid acyltransferase family protein [Smithellaceae bacterium]MDD3849914.1 lysophospholipid acyltransferase family protein [Smithellaceae bacterium]HPL10614.1 lysophospholipid acyltransferase family protein [Smithellaceae bacterium]